MISFKHAVKSAVALTVLGAILASCQAPVLDAPTGTSASRAAGEYREPSQNPPGGLQPAQVPQFLVFGFDDNQYADGMEAVLGLYANRKNPVGSGNTATFDGSAAVASFYVVPAKKDGSTITMTDAAAVATWKKAWQQGHEIGNHTYTHSQGGLTRDYAGWLSEIRQCQEFLTGTLGIPANEVVGFRTPFLEYNAATFEAVKAVGLQYDVSYEGGWRYWPAEKGATLFWPFTMDTGKPAGEEGRDFGKIPGLWQIPDDCIFYPDGSRTTGLDYNMWFSKSNTKAEFVAGLKHSLLQKYNGNRSPMNYGLHSNYYSVAGDADIAKYDPASYSRLKANRAERLEALKEFLDYAQTLPDVRIVSAKQLLQWLRTPVAINGGISQYTITASAGAGGTISPAGASTYQAGASATYTIAALPGGILKDVKVDGASVGKVYSYKFDSINQNHTISAEFEGFVPEFVNVVVSAGPNGNVSPKGTIKMEKSTTLVLNASPAAGYTVAGWIVDGVARAPAPAISVGPFTKDMQVSVSFAPVAACTEAKYTASAVYTGGAIVCHGGFHWQAQWWTQGQEPGTTGEWGVWKKIGPCPGGDHTIPTFKVDLQPGPGGRIIGPVNPAQGATAQYQILPDPGYEIAEVCIDGSVVNAIPAGFTYTFNSIQANHTIAATFRKVAMETFTIMASAGANGSISPAGAVTVGKGASQRFTFTPAAGYIVDRVQVNGTTVNPAADGSYTIANVQANGTITVGFNTTTGPEFPLWSGDNVAYKLGDKASHAGANWVCKYAHSSNSAWYPGASGLWIWEKL